MIPIIPETTGYAPGILTHLESGVTTLCYCWTIVRVDGTVIGVTDHDEDVTVDGVACSSATGMLTTKFEQSLGLTADDLEIEGVITDDQLTAEDLRAGKFDDATVKLYLVNWSDPTEFLHMASGKFGQITESDGSAFSVEFLSLSHDLLQPVGRHYQRTCDTKLGSSACGIDLTSSEYTFSANVLSADGATLTLTSLSDYDDGWFTLGKAEVNGQEIGIRLHEGDVIELWFEPDAVVSLTDEITLTVGCKQDSTTCAEKFNNIVNFQGFHLIPGNDAVTKYPVRGRDDYDGESLFS